MAKFEITPVDGVCRVERDPNAIAMIRHHAKLLRQAKQAHTEWEARFEGNPPEHDWEVWYAQWLAAKMMREEASLPVVPCGISKLMTLVGPLD